MKQINKKKIKINPSISTKENLTIENEMGREVEGEGEGSRN